MAERKDFRPHFDVPAMQASLVEPTIQIGDFVYVGRLHSAPEWFAWNERLQLLKAKVEAKTLTAAEVLAFYHEYFRSIFPASLFRRGVPFWAPDVANTLLQQPLEAIEDAFERFSARQATANGVTIEPRSLAAPMTTHGTSSNDSTPAAAPPVAAGA